MATLPLQVRPGDIISSDLMNAILETLADLNGSGISGTQVVPNVFGALLGDARAAILSPTRQLAMGFVLDSTGAVIDPLAPSNATRIVLNQSPVAEARVGPGTTVNLVVSGSSGTAPSGGLAPTITRTETPLGAATSSFRVGESLVLVGTNFSTTSSQNIVSFNGRPATVSNDPSDATRRLNVVVPTGITGAPVNVGDPPLAGVQLAVTTPGGGPVSITVTITAPSGVPLPTISGFSNAARIEGQTVVINGTNFSTTASRNQVTIGGVAAAVNSATATALTVTVPQLPNLAATQSRICQVVVTVRDASNNIIGTVTAPTTLTVVGA